LQPLWGENSAAAVGFFLQSLFQSPARPFAPFVQYFQFELAQ
jgi:hypothetical protein